VLKKRKEGKRREEGREGEERGEGREMKCTHLRYKLDHRSAENSVE
jgi:hypothetical protein